MAEASKCSRSTKPCYLAGIHFQAGRAETASAASGLVDWAKKLYGLTIEIHEIGAVRQPDTN
jgi:hypothetical protein